jgi:gliding motility-associated-like protein
MCPIKLKTNILRIFIFLAGINISFAQTPQPPAPTICTTPPSGYLIGGNLAFSPNAVGCVQDGNPTTPIILISKVDPNPAVNYKLDNAKFYTDIDNTFDLNTAVGKNAVGFQVSSNFSPGWHWTLMTGTKGTQKYLKCEVYEVISTKAPNVNVTACGGSNVTFNIPNDPANQHNSYRLDWGDGSPIETINVATTPLPVTKTHPFTGTPKIVTITGNYVRNATDVCPTAALPINPVNNNPTFIHTLEGENNGKEAKLVFVGHEPGKIYKLQGHVDNGTSSNNWTDMADAVNGNVVVTGLNATDKYCFRLKGTNTCGVEVFSDKICSIALRTNLRSTREVELRWNIPTEPSGMPERLQVIKNVVGCTTCLNTLPLTSDTQTSYNDQTLDCSKKYLFRVYTRYPVTLFNGRPYNVVVRSAQMTVDPAANSVPVKPNNYVSVGYDPNDEKTIRLNIDATGSLNNEYTFFRAENNNNNFIQVGTSKFNTFTDVSITNKPVSYCYKYQVKDQCGILSSQSDPFCTVLLDSKSQGVLNWTPYTVSADNFTSATPMEYEVQIFDDGLNSYIPFGIPSTNLESAVQKLLNDSKSSQLKFRIKATQYVDTPVFSNQLFFVYSNTYIMDVPPGLFIPTAFSPDGKGPTESETFGVESKFVASGIIKIYDRWGATLFESESLTDEWDGTEQNKLTPAPPGTYAYVINAISETGMPFKMTGSVLLLR